ncbi:MAG TPA: hypothetical protein VK013_03350 [Myxococcaceae bacterium]|nr:hypothetical protein [Myxococcaceae bacterium]
MASLPDSLPRPADLALGADGGQKQIVTDERTELLTQGPRREFFLRVRTPPPKRRWRFVWLIVVAVVGYGSYKAVFAPSSGVRAVTPYGLFTLRDAMPRADVDRALGGPIAQESGTSDNGCLLYGQPVPESSGFSLYRVCYEQGRIAQVSESRFESFGINEQNEIVVPDARQID